MSYLNATTASALKLYPFFPTWPLRLTLPIVALCWVSDFDEFELEISEGNDFELIQRFALTAVYYHFEGTSIANEFWNQN